MKEPIALYGRISTREGKQFLANQINALNRYVANQPSWRIVETITDEHTGSQEAPGWRRVISLAQQRRITRVIVWKLDRITRQGPAYTFRQIHLLSQFGCSIVSIQEPMFDAAGAFGPVLVAISAWIAEEETKVQRERVKAGLHRARQQGKKLGRPHLVIDRAKLTALRSQGLGLDLIGRALGISRASANRYIKQLEENSYVVSADSPPRRENEGRQHRQVTGKDRHQPPHQDDQANTTPGSTEARNHDSVGLHKAATRPNAQTPTAKTTTRPAGSNRQPTDTGSSKPPKAGKTASQASHTGKNNR
jgi:DNA invertase Pin-like site-specific DNA recombinase